MTELTYCWTDYDTTGGMTQGEGIVLPTGQAFYFRVRGHRVSLTISDCAAPAYSERNENTLAHYQRRFAGDNPVIDRIAAESYVSRWIAEHLSHNHS